MESSNKFAFADGVGTPPPSSDAPPPLSLAESIMSLMSVSALPAPELSSLSEDAVKIFLKEFDSYSKTGQNTLKSYIAPEILKYICTYELAKSCENVSDTMLLGYLTSYAKGSYRTAHDCVQRLEAVGFDYTLSGSDRIRSLFVSLESALIDMGLSESTVNQYNLLFTKEEQVSLILRKLPVGLMRIMEHRMKFMLKPIKKVPFMRALMEEDKQYIWDPAPPVEALNAAARNPSSRLEAVRKAEISRVKRRAEKRIAELLD